VSERVLRLAGEGGGHGQLGAAAGGPDERAHLQESEPDRATGGFGELRVSKAETAKGGEQDVSHRGEPETVDSIIFAAAGYDTDAA
jgi:hypothetical protein